jgi:hypothetical protein
VLKAGMMARQMYEVANLPSTNQTHCAVCADHRLSTFLTVPQVPVTCTSIFDTATEARDIPTGDIDLCVCERCGFVSNRDFDPDLGELGARYESSQAASPHFSAFAQSLAGDWLRRYELRGKVVVEVGCGSGDFMREMVRAGASRGIGVDPLAGVVPGASDDSTITCVAASFEPETHDFAASALICRHTLEHVKDIRGFLAGLRAWAGNGSGRVVLVELPDAERIFTERAFWDVYYEHCNYFSTRTVRLAFEIAGFTVLRVARAYNDQYLLVEAIANPDSSDTGRNTLDAGEVGSAVQCCQDFARNVYASVKECRHRLEQFYSDGPRVVLWQGAAKTVGLLSFLGSTASIECAVDLSPARHGRFLPGTGLMVAAPEILRRLRPKHIVLMNPVYLDEVRSAVDALSVSAVVHGINDLLVVG